MAVGPIEQSLTGVDDPKVRAQIKAQAILDRVALLPANRRATYTLNGYTVQLLSAPVILRDKQNRPVGLSVKARARDANNVILPSGDFTHNVVNPPVKTPDGTTSPLTRKDGSTVQVPNFAEDAVAALQTWLLDSILYDAVQNGYKLG